MSEAVDIATHTHWEAFCEFHLANPHVYDRLVELSRELLAKGHKKVGIGMLFEVLRWEHMLQTEGDTFKLNNNYRALYARMLMELEEGLAGAFEVRSLG